MELVGIVLSVPVAFVASLLYCLLLEKVIARRTGLSQLLRGVSYVVLTLFVVEIVLLETIGAVRSRRLLGPGFYVTHLALFFLCTPALANILVLRGKRVIKGRWWVAAFICAVFAFGLVMLQIGVSEALYGVDDSGGPYSTTQLQIPRFAASSASEGYCFTRVACLPAKAVP